MDIKKWREERKWKKAEKHLCKMIRRAKKIFGEQIDAAWPFFHYVVDPLLERYDNGERTEELYKDMMAVHVYMKSKVFTNVG